MKRYHQELERTKSAHRLHLRRLLKQSAPINCIWEFQVGRFRKRKAFVCSKVRCQLCNYEKIFGIASIKDRIQERRSLDSLNDYFDNSKSIDLSNKLRLLTYGQRCRSIVLRKMENQTVKLCDECESFFFLETSQMAGLCPECSFLLYGYENCQHIFVEDRCSKCYWDGSLSEFCKSLKSNVILKK